MYSDRPTPTLLGRGLAVALASAMATLLVLPSLALAQTAVPTSGTPAPTTSATPMASPTAAATAAATTVTGAALTLSNSKATPGTQITVNGTGFKSTEIVDVTFNGQSVGTPTADPNGNFSLSFTVPQVALGTYGVLATGRNSGISASTNFTATAGPAAVTLSVPQGEPGTAISITATGFQPGETVQLLFNGAAVGTPTADTNGTVTVPFTIPSVGAGNYVAEAHGQTSGYSATASFTVLASSATPAATTAPTASASPTAAPTSAPAATPGAVPTAPAMIHDERYFNQTGYRIDDDQIWSFFQSYGGLNTFGYPVSRGMSLLGCPVQMFQAQIIQVCPGQGPALINLLDPDIFPYTQINGSNFPAADPTLKANTPPVSDPNYSTNIIQFINANVPDTYNGQSVNFLQAFNGLGGLTIWGAPISTPQPDPNNANFIYQRFQRGIMHYTVGQGTQRILLADYMKSVLMNQNVPPDLLAQAKDSRFFNQYCPGAPQWLCRPADLGGTDLSFAFVQG